MKRLSPATVTIGVFAILFGLASAYAVRRYLDVPPEVAQPVTPKTAEVVVAAVNLPVYSRIREQDLKAIQVPADRAPKGGVTKAQALFRVVKSTIMADQPIMDGSLYQIGEVPRIEERIPEGFRAVTLPISGENALNGMIQPESHVDITLTYAPDKTDAQAMKTMTVMRNVLVLATSYTRLPFERDITSNVRNVTVAVAPEDANKLILAQRAGTLGVTLCGRNEQGDTLAATDADRHLIDRDTLLGIEPQPVPVEPVLVQKRVEVWRGSSKGEVAFGPDEILESINATAVAEGREPLKALPVSAPQDNAGGKKPCKDCEKKKAAAKAAEEAKKAAAQGAVEAINAAEEAARQGVPSRPISNPQPTPAGRAVEVQVEADQTGSK